MTDDDRKKRRVRRYKCPGGGYDMMLREQCDACAICGEDGPAHLDHDHAEGHVRGFLCARCNTGLGKFFDDPDLLRVAAQYIEACYNNTAEFHVQRYAVNRALRRVRRHTGPLRQKQTVKARGETKQTVDRGTP